MQGDALIPFECTDSDMDYFAVVNDVRILDRRLPATPKSVLSAMKASRFYEHSAMHSDLCTSHDRVIPQCKIDEMPAIVAMKKMRYESSHVNDRNVKCSMPRPMDQSQMNSPIVASSGLALAPNYTDIINSKAGVIFDAIASISDTGTIKYRDYVTQLPLSTVHSKRVLFIIDAQALSSFIQYYNSDNTCKSIGLLVPARKIIDKQLYQQSTIDFRYHFKAGLPLFRNESPTTTIYALFHSPTSMSALSTVPIQQVRPENTTTPFIIEKSTFQIRGEIMHQDIDIQLYRNHGNKLDILIDTGAGATSFMNKEQAMLLKLPKVKGPKPFVVTYANGQTMELNEFVEVSVRIGKVKIKLQAALVKDLSSPLILGDAWLLQNKAVLDYGARTIMITRPNGHKSMIKFSESSEHIDAPISTIGPMKITRLSAIDTANLYMKKEVADAWIFVVKPKEEDPPPEAKDFEKQVNEVIPGESAPELRLKAVIHDFKKVFPRELPNQSAPE